MEQAINNFLDNKVASMSPQEVTQLLSPDGTNEGLKLSREGGGFTEIHFKGNNTEIGSNTATIDNTNTNSATQGKQRRLKTREKIEKLCNEGARNYPAYLKLVHTGDSDFSDDETISDRLKSKDTTQTGGQNGHDTQTKPQEPGDGIKVPKKPEGTRIIENKLKQLKLNERILNKKKTLDLKIEDSLGLEKLGLTPEKDKTFQSEPNTPYNSRNTGSLHTFNVE